MARLLVVEDDEVDRELVTRCLEDFPDLELRFAPHAEAALGAMTDGGVDAVLTDLRMPGMSGLELVERLRDEHPLSPVILMTSMGNETIAVEALRAGAASYVPKGELKTLLADTVSQVLDLAAARRSRHRVLGFLERSTLSLDLPSDPMLIHPLAAFLQDQLGHLEFASESVRVQIGISLMEGIDNAVVHGNLEVESTLRRQSRASYQREIEERRRSEPFASRRLRVRAEGGTRTVEYHIEDEGPGFDATHLPDPTDPENLLHVSGRGILLMRTFMDEVRYEGRGNRLVLRKAGGRASYFPQSR
jgi:CheY-like chemotaxis protein/anti-sigma regulatory factor (Ser/Thr protein kinase)